jgi:NADP-dependent 3-hydroxy acid dehydrogenase YdfG
MKKTAVITGASSGFGTSCARRLAADGWALVLLARRGDRLAAVADELRGATQVHVAALDVRDRYAVVNALSTLPAPFDEPDLLLNNAGLALGINPAQTAELDDWDVMVDTNIKGLMYCTRAALPGMVSRNRGHVINIGSVAASWPYSGGNAYGATKAFVQQFSRNLRSDLLGTKVRVTNIEPGMAETEFSRVRFKGDDAKAERVYAGTDPLTAEDVAEVVHWVASLPERVNVNVVEVMPTCQAWSPLSVHRNNI